MDIEEGYHSILVADEFVKYFETMECFREWCHTGDLADLEEVRKGFVDAIRHQTSPIVVMNIAQALKMIGSEIPIDKYKDMLNSELPSETVIQIEEGLKII